MWRLYLRDLPSGEERVLAELGPVGEKVGGTVEVAYRTSNRLGIVRQNRAMVMEMDQPGEFHCVYQAPEGAKLDGLFSLRGDGSTLLLRESKEGINTALEVDLKTGAVRQLFSKNWHANHFHYVPYDENWVAFSHEGWTEDIFDRCWVWHAEHAPEGRVAFDQASDVPGMKLCVGHERWCFHDISGYVIAYAHSPAPRRGLWEIFADGRPAQLRWESDVLWHCTMDLSGRFVACDTSGPFQMGRHSQEDYERNLARFRCHDKAKEPFDLEVVVLDLQKQEALHLGQARSHIHPYHPHPHISLDGRWVAWNDAHPDHRGIWLAEIGRD